MKRLLLFILLSAACSEADQNIKLTIPAHLVQFTIFCSDASDGLIIIRQENKIFYVKFNEFQTSYIIQGWEVCKKFVEEWQSHLIEKGENEISLNLVKEPEKSGKIIRWDSAGVYSFADGTVLNECKKLGYCATDLLSRFNIKPALYRCNPAFSWRRYLSFIKPRLKIPRYQVIKKVNLDIFPFKSFNQSLMDLSFKEPQSEFILSSTMNFGITTAKKLSEVLKNSAAKILLALDARLMFLSDPMSLLELFYEHPNVFLLPITTNSDFKSTYHWKIILGNKLNESILTAMNFSVSLDKPYTDIIYRFQDDSVKNELSSLLVSAMQEQCEAAKDFKCLAEFMSKKPESVQWAEILNQSCNVLRQASGNFHRKYSKRYFLQPGDTDINFLANAFINRAEKEIIVLTHQLFADGLIDSLKNAEERGVKVFVIAVNMGKRDDLSSKNYINLWNDYPESFIPEPHFKTIIIDRKKMFFGTGNFTTNAMLYARELFAFTDDKDAISTIISLASSLFRLAVSHNTLLPQPYWEAERQLIVMKDKKSDQPSHSSRQIELLEKYSFDHKEEWMKHYREIKVGAKSKLKTCGLAGYVFISTADFFSCFESL